MRRSSIDQHDLHLVEDLRELLVIDAPVVRSNVVQAACARLADGDHPTALDLASTLVAHFA
ncbi:MAG: hypothetical protein QOC92_2066 [Acidimicrobiaceae bacterium]|jgi:hypothetical protein